MTESEGQLRRLDAGAQAGRAKVLFRIQTLTGRYDLVNDRPRLCPVGTPGDLFTRFLLDCIFPVKVTGLFASRLALQSVGQSYRRATHCYRTLTRHDRTGRRILAAIAEDLGDTQL